MDYDNEDEVKAGFAVFNATDGVYFDPRTFQTEEEASIAAEEHRAAYARQGYYLTVDRMRIDPADLELEIVSVTE